MADVFFENTLLDKTDQAKKIRKNILDLVKNYSLITHNKKPFEAGKTLIPVSGKVYDYIDIQMLISASLDFWLTADRFNREFERILTKFLNTTFAITVNSGSSANLLALSSFLSNSLAECSLKPGDEVITLAAGFPTTVNPIIQNGLIPVFVDIDIPTYAVDVDQLEDAVTERTKAIMIPHTLGNPFDVNRIQKIVSDKGLWFVEDCCDALGSKINGKHVGNFGDIATLSFYPAHQITMGEGGAIYTKNPILKRVCESLRDWGRDCFCEPGRNNTCGKRFGWKLGQLPSGYDHKYTYSHVGYNLKITEMQAAVGLAQMQHLDEFVQTRKQNFNYLKEGLSSLDNYLILPEPTRNSEPSWFGFPITIRKNSDFSREKLINFLSSKLIDTRPLFAGNITRQPYFSNVKYRVKNELHNTDIIMSDSFWIGVFPGLTIEMLDYVIQQFKVFIKMYS